MVKPLKIGMLLFPRFTQLDLTGPYEILSRMSHSEVLLLAKDNKPVASDQGLAIVPTHSLEQCPALDVLFVPGGPGVLEVMEDEVYSVFLKVQGARANYVTAVCTGSLILASVGLLDGYQATTHWLSLDLLRLFNVEVLKHRVVIDRNRMTGGGVTAGIDFGLSLVAQLRSEAEAKRIQLLVEYNPAPPFNAGHPDIADSSIVDAVSQKREVIQKNRKERVLRLDFILK